MKLAMIGDIHLSERSPRYAHVLEVLDFVIEDALVQANGEPLAWIFLGDLFEGQPTGGEYSALFDRIQVMRGPKGQQRVAALLGNHEAYHAIAFWHHLGVDVAWDQALHLGLHFLEADLLLVPYARRGRAPFADLPEDGTIKGSMTVAASRIAQLVADAVRPGRPLIVCGHFTVEGMKVKDSEFELHTATEVVVPQSAFVNVALAAVGHIHTPQDVAPNIIGVGSLIRHSFAEADDEKSYTLVSIDDGHVSWERRPVPARAMKPYHMAWDPGQQVRPFEPEDVAGKEVKITVEIPEDQLATFDASFFDVIKAAASHFILEKVTVAKDRTRSTAIAKAETLEEQLVAWLAATYPDIATQHYERLCTKLAEVQA